MLKKTLKYADFLIRATLQKKKKTHLYALYYSTVKNNIKKMCNIYFVRNQCFIMFVRQVFIKLIKTDKKNI